MKKINFFKCILLVKVCFFSSFIAAQAQQNTVENVVIQSTNSIDSELQHGSTNKYIDGNNDNELLKTYAKHIENDANSVQTLMRLETMQAISEVQRANKNLMPNKKEVGLSNLNNKVANDHSVQVNDPYLKSIYGIGSKLKAKINYKQRDFIYKKGQEHPIGVNKKLNNILLMTDFSDLCITLVGGNNTYDLCLNNY